MNQQDKDCLIHAADVLRMQAKEHWDEYKHNSDARDKTRQQRARDSFEKHQQLNRMALELEVTVAGNGL